jgi:hypothetical protein
MKIKKNIGFRYKIQFLKFERKKNWAVFRFIDHFLFIDRFSVGFLFKIQILNKNGKPPDFTDLSLCFPVYRSSFFIFVFSKFEFFKL